MTRYIINLLASLCLCFLFVACSQEEESTVTACDNENVANMVEQYDELFLRAIDNADCETILSVTAEITDFIDENYNCLIIYYVLTDDTIETDRDAEQHLEDVKELMEGFSYLCEIEEAPFFD
ncbi:hypothetical protein [Flammeovirga sp. SJP92]|uniref:hypothetical protein n=1 Tax=Flammeovirga sp. SJP92 TaxID=1775430 RepID=UPI0012FCB043|nr:hypothetical protein [Flammeovirga sp. SJP92]